MLHNLKTRITMNAKIQCLLFALKRSYFCYYIFCMTVPLIDGSIPTLFPHKEQKEERENETPAHMLSCEFC